MKRAFIDTIMLGFLLLGGVVIFIATTADDISVQNKIANLKKLTNATALGLANHYIDNGDTTSAESIIDEILLETPLGIDAKDYIAYTWDFTNEPNSVKATISNYKHNNFWYRFLGKDEFIIEKIESKANIVLRPADNLPVIDTVSDFMPFAVNECGQSDGVFTIGDQHSFIYKSYALYDSSESKGFYGITPTNPEPRSGDQSDFAHFKNEVYDFDRVDNQQYLVDTIQETIENDAQQLASALEVHKFEEPMDISIAILDCSSTKDNVIISSLLPVEMTNIYCGDKTTSITNIESAFSDQTGEVFDDITWVEWVDDKDCSQSGLFRMDITVRAPEVETAVIEY